MLFVLTSILYDVAPEKEVQLALKLVVVSFDNVGVDGLPLKHVVAFATKGFVVLYFGPPEQPELL